LAQAVDDPEDRPSSRREGHLMTTVSTSPAKRHQRAAIEGCPDITEPNRPNFRYDANRRAACRPRRP
jgi:hypothetical protein